MSSVGKLVTFVTRICSPAVVAGSSLNRAANPSLCVYVPPMLSALLALPLVGNSYRYLAFRALWSLIVSLRPRLLLLHTAFPDRHLHLHDRGTCSLCGRTVHGAGRRTGNIAKNRAGAGRGWRRRQKPHIRVGVRTSRQNRSPHGILTIGMPSKNDTVTVVIVVGFTTVDAPMAT